MPGNPTADHRKKAVLLPWKTTKAAYTFSQGAAENASEINDRKRVKISYRAAELVPK